MNRQWRGTCFFICSALSFLLLLMFCLSEHESSSTAQSAAVKGMRTGVGWLATLENKTKTAYSRIKQYSWILPEHKWREIWILIQSTVYFSAISWQWFDVRKHYNSMVFEFLHHLPDLKCLLSQIPLQRMCLEKTQFTQAQIFESMVSQSVILNIQLHQYNELVLLLL